MPGTMECHHTPNIVNVKNARVLAEKVYLIRNDSASVNELLFKLCHSLPIYCQNKHKALASRALCFGWNVLSIEGSSC